MEAALHARDRVGVQDFVLLEDFTNIDAFLDNLKKRSSENLIYVSNTLGLPQVEMYCGVQGFLRTCFKVSTC